MDTSSIGHSSWMLAYLSSRVYFFCVSLFRVPSCRTIHADSSPVVCGSNQIGPHESQKNFFWPPPVLSGSHILISDKERFENSIRRFLSGFAVPGFLSGLHGSVHVYVDSAVIGFQENGHVPVRDRSKIPVNFLRDLN